MGPRPRTLITDTNDTTTKAAVVFMLRFRGEMTVTELNRQKKKKVANKSLMFWVWKFGKSCNYW